MARVSLAKKSHYTLDEIIDFVTNNDIELLHKDASNKEDGKVIMFPPVEQHDAVTDCDIDASDDMNDGLVDHLPRRLLNSHCETNMLSTNVPTTSSSEEDFKFELRALQKATSKTMKIDYVYHHHHCHYQRKRK